MKEYNTPVWAIIELMGHVRTGGLVSKDTSLGTPLLRVDVPQKDGSSITQFVNPSSIYRLTIASEELSRAAALDSLSLPLSKFEIRHLLPAPEPTPLVGELSIPDQEDDEDDESPL